MRNYALLLLSTLALTGCGGGTSIGPATPNQGVVSDDNAVGPTMPPPSASASPKATTLDTSEVVAATATAAPQAPPSYTINLTQYIIVTSRSAPRQAGDVAAAGFKVVDRLAREVKPVVVRSHTALDVERGPSDAVVRPV